ncbi:MAG: hypothetical protein AB8H86_05540, partial [Polyangiales bacterium]
MSLPSTIHKPLGAVRRRIRAQRALDAGMVFVFVGLGIAAVALTFAKTGALDLRRVNLALWFAGAMPFLGALLGALRPIHGLLPAQLIDRSHNLSSRLSNAMEFSALSEQSEFMTAAIEDAAAQCKDLKANRAMPLRAPRDWMLAVGLGLGVFALSLFEVSERHAAATVAELEPLLLDADSLDGFERSLDPVLRDSETSEDVRRVARELNSVLEDMLDRRLNRSEALRRIQQLESRLAEGRPMDAEALEQSLEEVGQDLQRSGMTEAASEALQEHDAAAAAEAIQELAERVAADEAPSRRELDRLREALERAAEDESERREEELQEERDELESLLQRERDKAGESEREQRLLRRQRRQLERLQREQNQLQEQRRQLERLRREMQQAAEQLNRNAQDRNQASEAMRRMAEELNRMAREQMSEEQRQQLQRQMEQLREMIRRSQQNGGQGQGQQQQGQGQGQGRQGRLQRFTLGAGGRPLRMPGQGQQGQGQGQQGQGQGQQGQGQGQQGQG